MKPYPEYKDSGVEWIGEIPKNWEAIKIRRFTTVKRGASPRPINDKKYFDDDGEFAWVRIADVSAAERYLTKTTQTLSELGASLSVKRYPGDLFLSIAGTVGKPIITDIKCCIHDGFVWFPELKINPEYLYYIFSTGLPYQGLGKLGTQLNLNTDTVADIAIPLSDESVLEDIISYLDHKTQQIDTLIGKKKRLMELVKEERTAVINEAVTKGLDPNVSMKDSGIEWLGKIPKHWKPSRLKFATSNIVDCLHSTPEYSEDGIYPAVRTADVFEGKLDLSKVRYVEKVVYEERISRLKPEFGDIVYTREGERFGLAALVPDGVELCLSQRMMMFRCAGIVEPEFMMWQLSSKLIYNQALQDVLGSTSPHVNVETIKNFKVLLPPKGEQVMISDFLNKETSRIDTIISKAEKEIELLQEYRTALISEVVTGKIDVRDWRKPEHDSHTH